MKVEWKIDVSLIVASLIVSLAAVSVARIMAPKRYVPMGATRTRADALTGVYLDTEKGEVGFGPVKISSRAEDPTWIPTDEEQAILEKNAESGWRELEQLLREMRRNKTPAASP